MLKKVPS